MIYREKKKKKKEINHSRFFYIFSFIIYLIARETKWNIRQLPAAGTLHLYTTVKKNNKNNQK